MVSFFNYGNYSSENYGAHTLAFYDGKGNTFYFSYKTLVAFSHNGNTYVRQNIWGNTTGKHLNWIDGGDKKSRLTQEEFEQKYNEFFGDKVISL